MNVARASEHASELAEHGGLNASRSETTTAERPGRSALSNVRASGGRLGAARRIVEWTLFAFGMSRTAVDEGRVAPSSVYSGDSRIRSLALNASRSETTTAERPDRSALSNVRASGGRLGAARRIGNGLGRVRDVSRGASAKVESRPRALLRSSQYHVLAPTPRGARRPRLNARVGVLCRMSARAVAVLLRKANRECDSATRSGRSRTEVDRTSFAPASVAPETRVSVLWHSTPRGARRPRLPPGSECSVEWRASGGTSSELAEANRECSVECLARAVAVFCRKATSGVELCYERCHVLVPKDECALERCLEFEYPLWPRTPRGARRPRLIAPDRSTPLSNGARAAAVFCRKANRGVRLCYGGERAKVESRPRARYLEIAQIRSRTQRLAERDDHGSAALTSSRRGRRARSLSRCGSFSRRSLRTCGRSRSSRRRSVPSCRPRRA